MDNFTIMLMSYVEHLRVLLHQNVAGAPSWVEDTLSSMLDFLTGPFTGVKTRYYWLDIVEALLIVVLIYVLRTERSQRFSLQGFLRFCFPKDVFAHPSSILDYQLNVTNYFFAGFFNIFWRFNTVFMTAWVLGALTWAFGPPTPLLQWSLPVLAVFTILMAAMEDLGYYWMHFASHKVQFLWAFHKLHHSAEALTPLTAARVHPVELAITGPCKSAAMALLIAPALYVFVGEATLVQLFGMNLALWIFGALGNQLHHSHIWISWGPRLERILISPAQHQVHHSIAREHWDRNFGANFAVWDWLFGTLYLTRSHETITFGLAGSLSQTPAPQIHTGLITAYLLPFWEMFPASVRGLAIRMFQRICQRLARPTTAG
jgi:sterol desaturase/sphingolipid hydroxylase (fatty acid hydroxylase superfamily)